VGKVVQIDVYMGGSGRRLTPRSAFAVYIAFSLIFYAAAVALLHVAYSGPGWRYLVIAVALSQAIPAVLQVALALSGRGEAAIRIAAVSVGIYLLATVIILVVLAGYYFVLFLSWLLAKAAETLAPLAAMPWAIALAAAFIASAAVAVALRHNPRASLLAMLSAFIALLALLAILI